MIEEKQLCLRSPGHKAFCSWQHVEQLSLVQGQSWAALGPAELGFDPGTQRSVLRFPALVLVRAPQTSL